MYNQFWKIFESAARERGSLKQDQKKNRSLQKEEIRKAVLSKEDFKQHEKLSSKVWGDQDHLKLEVKLKLKRIANAFLRDHNINPDAVEDIYFTGSLAGYNYHPDSDVDLHIVVDFSKVNQDIDMVRDLFNSRRLVWNGQHNITIQREGAYSPENIAFKILRKQGYIDQLAHFRSDSYDKMMSLPQ